MKYLHRQPPKTAGRTAVEERIRGDMSDLMAKEQAVLEAWAAQRRRLDDCVKFVTVEVSPPLYPTFLSSCRQASVTETLHVLLATFTES